MNIRVRTILVGMPAIHDPGTAEAWTSGIVKRAVTGRVRIGHEGIAGDGQADRSVHGGPEKALLGYCADHYPAWRAELGRDDLADGAFGENLACIGVDEESAAIGDRFRLGEALIEVSQPRQPCWKLARRCGLPTMPALAIATGRLGWYFRVIEPGTATPGDALVPEGGGHAGWTIARINRLFFAPGDTRAGLAEVLPLARLSPEFAALCRKRLHP